MTIKHVADSEIAWEIEPLARSIDPQNSSYRVMSTKIEFKLTKVASGVRWSNIEGDEEASGSTTYGIRRSKLRGDDDPSLTTALQLLTPREGDHRTHPRLNARLIGMHWPTTSRRRKRLRQLTRTKTQTQVAIASSTNCSKSCTQAQQTSSAWL